jgi:hypothetical protein
MVIIKWTIYGSDFLAPDDIIFPKGRKIASVFKIIRIISS